MTHVAANPVFEGGRVRIDTGGTRFDTEQGLRGNLSLVRWINRPKGDDRACLQYSASVTLYLTNDKGYCEDIGIRTRSLNDVLAWIQLQVKKINAQLKLDTTAEIIKALQSLHDQFKSFLPNLQSESTAIRRLLDEL